jgi:hypothetical protein
VNQALATALDDALRQLGDELPADWRRIVMIKNDGPIPLPAHPVVGDAARGFNLLLLSAEGEPAYYVRCRDASDAMAAREAEVLRQLSESPAIRIHLPEAAGTRADGIQVLATRYMNGDLLAHLLRRMSHDEWRDAVLALTELATDVGNAGRMSIPELTRADPFDFWQEAEASLALLPMSSGQLAATAAALQAAGTAPRFPQHGDLWPGNVIRERGVWRLLDFDLFGRVDAPLFDACHLTFTSTEYLLSGGHGLDVPWIKRLEGHDILGRGGREILRRNALAQGLSGGQAVGAVVYYLVEATARLVRKGAHSDVWRGPLAEAAAAADLLKAGGDAREIFFPELMRERV